MENKKEKLSKFYALRAVMSKISLHKDEVVRQKERIESAREREYAKDTGLSNREIKEIGLKHWSCPNNCLEAKEQYEKAKNYVKIRKNRPKGGFFSFCLIYC